ncbi:hypothetical protein NFI96_025650, partial [Prochilodus magdalenae]
GLVWGAEMWAGVSVALALCVLAGSRAESEPDGARCKAPPVWKIGETEPLKDSLGQYRPASHRCPHLTWSGRFEGPIVKAAVSTARVYSEESFDLTDYVWSELDCFHQTVTAIVHRMDGLRLKLEKMGYANITYMVVNSQEENSRRLHSVLEQRLSDSIALYGQDPEAPDVWQIANVAKDDFQIYDRCGRLTHHLSLPYTILSQPYVEEAIKKTYCDGMCGECATESSIRPLECNATVEEQPEEVEEGAGHSHSPDAGHGHHGGHHPHHRHHHGHHGGQDRGHHGSGERHSHGDSHHHQHGHQGQVVIRQVQRGQVVSGHAHPQVAYKQLDLGQVGLRQIDLGQVEARDPQVMQQP